MKHKVDTDFSSLLSTIQKVDAPPFLLTRIKEKIKTNPEIKIGLGWVFAGSVSLILVLVVNVVVMSKSNVKNQQTTNLVASMNLAPDNTLYQ
jgi:hypothetical protein